MTNSHIFAKEKKQTRQPLVAKKAAEVLLEHDRASVRRGKIFASQEERDYTEQLWQMYTEH